MAVIEHLSIFDRNTTEYLYSLYSNSGIEDGWTNEDKYRNYELLMKIAGIANIPLAGTTVLDAGCGTGDLFPVLTKQGIKNYCGIDLCYAAISSAKRKYPNARFLRADILSMQFNEQYDYVFSSGTFAARLVSDNYAFVEAGIRKMWSLSTAGVAFNLLTDIGSPHDAGLFFYCPETIQAICAQTIGTNGQMVFITSLVGIDKELTQLNGYLFKRGSSITPTPSTRSPWHWRAK